MSIFTAIGNFFSTFFGSKKKVDDKEWAGLDYGKPAQPSNLMPLDPNDPWKT
jgi:hypothetical protein